MRLLKANRLKKELSESFARNLLSTIECELNSCVDYDNDLVLLKLKYPEL